VLLILLCAPQWSYSCLFLTPDLECHNSVPMLSPIHSHQPLPAWVYPLTSLASTGTQIVLITLMDPLGLSLVHFNHAKTPVEQASQPQQMEWLPRSHGHHLNDHATTHHLVATSCSHLAGGPGTLRVPNPLFLQSNSVIWHAKLSLMLPQCLHALPVTPDLGPIVCAPVPCYAFLIFLYPHAGSHPSYRYLSSPPTPIAMCSL